MEDYKIIELFMARDENAIKELEGKYKNYCNAIAYNILNDTEDAKECVNDAFLTVWNTVPPENPKQLSAFLGKITRNLSLKKHRAKTAIKRGGGEYEVILNELLECTPSKANILETIEAKELAVFIDSFLRSLPIFERNIFIRRYWYFDSIDTLSKAFDMSKGQIKMRLLRTRKKLLESLKKEGQL